MTKKWLIIGGTVLAALLAAVVILLIVVIGQNNSSSEQQELDRVTAICEDRFADPYGTDLDAFTQCQDELLSN